MSNEKRKIFKSKMKDFWQKYESKIILATGMILVAALAFQAGILKGQKWAQEPLIIEKSVLDPACLQKTQENQFQNQSSASESAASTTTAATNLPKAALVENCAFVGSKNSNKYHLPTCRWAKQIKPENIVCFSSTEDANQKGYQPDKNCIK